MVGLGPSSAGSRRLHLPLTFGTVCLSFCLPNLSKTKAMLLGKRLQGCGVVGTPRVSEQQATGGTRSVSFESRVFKGCRRKFARICAP